MSSAKSTRFSGGGGSVVSKTDAIQWGGGFRGLQSRRDPVGGGSTMDFSFMGPFYIFRLSQGGPGPPGPP